MGTIGIICNPQSGKDIRRLVTTATTIDDTEKLNIVERMVNAVLDVSEHEIVIMPDRFGYGKRIIHKMEKLEQKKVENVHIDDMAVYENQSDTTLFASKMAQRGAAVLIVMGGDGTNRVAAKGSGNVPLISISTGTNNVFPEMLEGTTVGLAAGAIASGYTDSSCVRRAKQIEITRNGEAEDTALIDMVFCRQQFTGSRAVWNYDEIDSVVTTQCHPASIGFSALIGTSMIVEREDDFGAMARFDGSEASVFAPMGAGSIQRVSISACEKVALDTEVARKMDYQGTLALDGEREVTFYPGDTVGFCITRSGPYCVNVKKTLATAMANGFFKDLKNMRV